MNRAIRSTLKPTVPVVSLYSETREPTLEAFKKIDVLLIDLQDVGTRVYTYTATIGLCLEAAALAGTRVVVLDRPNPDKWHGN